MKSPKSWWRLATLGVGFGAVVFWLMNVAIVGRRLDSYRTVPVFDNGLLFFRSYGRNYSADGYYLGQKWQCVEFVKRFYFEAFHHRMPDVMGHAKDYFDPAVPHRAMNARRGMVQYVNGGDEAPQTDDLMVFQDTRYGHVAIVAKVSGDTVEVIQQNILGHPRAQYALTRVGTGYRVSSPRAPAGWLRLPQRTAPDR